MSFIRQVFAVTAATLLALPGQAAIVPASFNVTSATLLQLYSGTLDPACTPSGGFFFCTVPLAPGAIAITNLGGGAGTIDLQYETTTGEVTEITDLNFYVNDLDIKITASLSGDVTIRQGNSMPVANDFARLRAGTGAPNGSVDADQDATVGTFRHDAPGSQIDATDFATFTDVVDTCVGTVCSLIPLLAIDALRYEIVGVVSGGVYNGALRAETSNNSNYFVNFTSTLVPLPATGWLLLTGVGGLVARRWQKGSKSAA